MSRTQHSSIRQKLKNVGLKFTKDFVFDYI